MRWKIKAKLLTKNLSLDEKELKINKYKIIWSRMVGKAHGASGMQHCQEKLPHRGRGSLQKQCWWQKQRHQSWTWSWCWPSCSAEITTNGSIKSLRKTVNVSHGAKAEVCRSGSWKINTLAQTERNRNRFDQSVELSAAQHNSKDWRTVPKNKTQKTGCNIDENGRIRPSRSRESQWQQWLGYQYWAKRQKHKMLPARSSPSKRRGLVVARERGARAEIGRNKRAQSRDPWGVETSVELCRRFCSRHQQPCGGHFSSAGSTSGAGGTGDEWVMLRIRLSQAA